LKQPVFTGYGLMMVTPMTRTGIDFQTLDGLLGRQLDSGCKAFFVGGTAGQGNLMTDAELTALVRFCRKKCGGRARIIACTGRPGTAQTVALSRAAQGAGADAAMVVTPYYVKASADGLIRHYTAVADALEIPVIVGDCPPRTGVTATAQLYAALKDHPNINGVKEINTHEFALLIEAQALCGGALNFWTGADNLIAASMAVGAQGVASILGNLMPEMIAQTVACCQAGDFSGAAALQIAHIRLMRRLFIEPHPIAIITAMNLLGMGAGEMRLPLCPMAPHNEQLLREAMRASGLAV
jgi:4-hydroxy-tetrahydrodipicolinate synthase